MKDLINKIRKRLYMIRAPRLLSENRYFTRFNIGEYTFGCPEVLVWDDHFIGLTIGKYCSIAKDVTILLGGEHRYDWLSTYSFPDFFDISDDIGGEYRVTKGEVKIGNDVWIGYGATILSGVTIGNGAVIGARSVVAKDIPPYSIAVGNPVRIIDQRFNDHTVRLLNQLAWWDWPVEKINKNADILMSSNLDELLRRSK